MFKAFIYYIKYLGSIFLVRPVLVIQEIGHYFVMNRLFGKKYTTKLLIDNTSFCIPNEHHVFYTIHEVFTRNLYQNLIGCKNILDLGGFIGETGVWLASNNLNVSIYEPNPANFSFIEKNIKSKPNITVYEGAVLGEKTDQHFYYDGGDFNAGGKIVAYKTKQKISTYYIGDILSQTSFDGLKMDIEGGEYSIIKYFLSTKYFPFQKGYIEFHYYLDPINRSILNQFISFLDDLGYHIEYEDVHGKKINIDAIDTIDPRIFVIYFEK